MEILSKGCNKDKFYTNTSLNRWLKQLLIASGLEEELQSENPPKDITCNSGRHYYATWRRVDGESWEDLALHMGHSRDECETRYSKATADLIKARQLNEDKFADEIEEEWGEGKGYGVGEGGRGEKKGGEERRELDPRGEGARGREGREERGDVREGAVRERRG